RDRAPGGAEPRRADRARLGAGQGHPRAHRARARARARGGGRVTSILLVDDDPGVLDVVAFTLRREGYDVDEEKDGTAALEAARGNGYDIVILDIMSPGRAGSDVCRALRAERDVPILILTARAAEHG